MGKLTDERFSVLSADYEQEQAELKAYTAEMRGFLNESEAVAVNIESFLQIVRKYTDPTELTPAILHELVDRVVVHEADKSSGRRVQQVDVHYNFIGEIDLSPEYSRTIKIHKGFEY